MKQTMHFLVGLGFSSDMESVSFLFNFIMAVLKSILCSLQEGGRCLSVSPERQRQCENAECRLEIRRLPYLIDSDILTGKYRRR